jgi:hypothetical protein
MHLKNRTPPGSSGRKQPRGSWAITRGKDTRQIAPMQTRTQKALFYVGSALSGLSSFAGQLVAKLLEDGWEVRVDVRLTFNGRIKRSGE